MTSDSDKPSDEGKPANRSEAEFDEFDDFDDFDDFDEAAGLDAFDDGDDPFDDASESEIDDLDAAAAELDAFADDDEGEVSDSPEATAETPAEEAAEPPAAEEPAADDFAADEFEADDFAADEFEADEFTPPPAADAADSGDDFAADEFDADEFTPPPAAEEPAAEADDFSEGGDQTEEVAAEAVEPEPAAEETATEEPASAADDDLDAMLQAQSGGDDDPFDQAVEEATAEEAAPAEETAATPEEEAAPVEAEPAAVDTAALEDDPADEDAAFLDEEPAAETVDTADDDDDLMPAAENVAGLSGDEALSQSDAAETLASESTMEVGGADNDAVAEPLMDDTASEAMDEADEPASEPEAEAAAEEADEPVAAEPPPPPAEEPTGEAPDAEDTDVEVAAAAAASTAAAAAVADAPQDAADDEEAAEAPPAPRPRKRGKGPAIPLIDVGSDGFDKLAEAYPKRIRAVHALASRKLTKNGLKFADQLCRKWSSKATVPYRTELDRISGNLDGEPGAHVINLAFEMGCTTGAAEDPEGGQRLLHTLDWNLDGIGRMLVAARRHCDAGLWVNFTWPGYIGCLQGIAPGRFAAAINHAPINGSGPKPLAWAMSKMKWYGQKGMPPAFLLRKVFDECEDFDAAVAMIEKTPICYPAIFSVLGVQDGEFSVIERTENAKSTQKRAPAVTNHWLNSEFKGTVTAFQSPERLVAIKSRIAKGVDESNWLVHPILNPDTRLSVDLNPTTGRMRVRTYQGLQPSSSFLDIYAD